MNYHTYLFENKNKYISFIVFKLLRMNYLHYIQYTTNYN